jgi:hypothetical protein
MQVAGCYVYFMTRLSAIRIEMREQLKLLPDDQLTRLILTKQEYLTAKVDEHEVKVNGKMYDISRVEQHGDQILVYGIHDEAEDNLLTFLEEMVTRSANDKKPIPTQLSQLLTLTFILEVEPKCFGIEYQIIHHATVYSEMQYLITRSILSPPPRS